MMASVAADDAKHRRGDLMPAALLLGALFLLLVWPPIFAGAEGTSEAFDHREYHEPVIRTFAEQLPRPDLVHYQSATSPGYHLFMAGISRYVTDQTIVLQLISSLFSLGLVLIVFRAAAVNGSAWRAVLLTLPLLFSPYLLSGAIWLTTDNAAWMFVALALGGCVMQSATPARVAACSASALAGVAIRQIHVWVAAPLAVAALVQSSLASRANGRSSNRFTLQWLIALSTTIVPVALIGWFIFMWGGLMPPAYVELHNRGMNPAMLPMTLSLAGAFGILYVPVIGVNSVANAIRRRSVWIAAAIGLMAAVAFPTSFSRDDGRWGGSIWQAANLLPVVADRSLLFVPLSALGCMVMMILWQSAAKAGRGRSATILLFALACWAAAQMMNSQAWQRYSEPIVLLTLAWLAALASTPSAATHRSVAASALLTCAAVQLTLSMVTVYMPVLGWR